MNPSPPVARQSLPLERPPARPVAAAWPGQGSSIAPAENPAAHREAVRTLSDIALRAATAQLSRQRPSKHRKDPEALWVMGRLAALTNALHEQR